MKRFVLLLLLFISTLSFGQTDEKFLGFPKGAKSVEFPHLMIPSTEQSIELDKLIKDFELHGENSDLNRCSGCCYIVIKMPYADHTWWLFNCNGHMYYVFNCGGNYSVQDGQVNGILTTPNSPC